MTQEPIYIILESGEIKPVLCTTRPLKATWLENHYPGMEFKTVETPTDFRIIEAGTHYTVAKGQTPEVCWQNMKKKKHLGRSITPGVLVSLAENFARLLKMQHGVEFVVVRRKIRNI